MWKRYLLVNCLIAPSDREYAQLAAGQAPGMISGRKPTVRGSRRRTFPKHRRDPGLSAQGCSPGNSSSQSAFGLDAREEAPAVDVDRALQPRLRLFGLAAEDIVIGKAVGGRRRNAVGGRKGASAVLVAEEAVGGAVALEQLQPVEIGCPIRPSDGPRTASGHNRRAAPAPRAASRRAPATDIPNSRSRCAPSTSWVKAADSADLANHFAALSKSCLAK